MHGTYVNGLQLHREETAELQDGTEITFGADVTRGEEVFPAKTFRVGVQWQRLQYDNTSRLFLERFILTIVN